ncbi:MAG: CHASE2 domain-containing protein [Candidatus Auribacterota bacterium]|jgi:putative nucleotidyltransferase with HDIG domain|nr:CHASE2 domain-containing protein [Candidatus Auribacterota bacterium]
MGISFKSIFKQFMTPFKKKTTNPSNFTLKTVLTTGVIIGLIISVCYYIGLFDKLEAIAIDLRFQFRQNPPLSKNLAVIGVTKNCIDDMGEYPIPRDAYADVINYISEGGAKSICLDIFFDLPSSNSEADMRLAEAIRTAGNVTLPTFTAQKITALPVRDGMYSTVSMRNNLKIFEDATKRRGHINIIPGSDGKIRYVPGAIREQDEVVFPMAIESYLEYRGVDKEQVEIGLNYFKIDNLKVPLDNFKTLQVNYFNPENAIDFMNIDLPSELLASGISFFYFNDVLKGHVASRFFKDKIVLLGQTSHGLSNSDEYITPFDVMFGAFIQASLINSLLTENFVQKPSVLFSVACIFLISIFCAALFLNLSLPRVCLVCVAVLVICLVGSMIIFNHTGFILEIVPILIAIAFNFAVHLIKRIQKALRLVVEKEVELGIINRVGEKFLDIYHVSDTPEMVLRNITDSLQIEGCLLYLKNKDDNQMLLNAEIFKKFSSPQRRLKLELLETMQYLGSEIHNNKKPILINDFQHANKIESSIKSLLMVPLVIHREIIGIICLCNKWNTSKKMVDNFSNDDLKLLKSLIAQSAISLENYILFNNMHDLFMHSIKALVAAIEAKDPYTAGHSERVTAIAGLIAQEIGFGAQDQEDLRIAAILHDIGKIGISEQILCSKQRLTDEEFVIIKSHPGKGADILQHVSEFAHLIPGVRHHHERYDGRGYPDGLSGENIPLKARIIAVADTFDAITSNRTYRQKNNFEFAIEEIKKCSGSQFDPKIVEVFLKCYDKYKNMPESPLYNAETQQAEALEKQ